MSLARFAHLSAVAVTLLVAACYEEHDDVLIDHNGDVTLESVIRFDERKGGLDDAQKMVALAAEQLRRDGWTITVKNTTTQPTLPVFSISASANIRSLSRCDFYSIEPIDPPNSYRLVFLPGSMWKEPPWSVHFKRRLFVNDAEITGPDGSRVEHIPQVSKRIEYTIHLQ